MALPASDSYRVCCPQGLLDQLRRVADTLSPSDQTRLVTSLEGINQRLTIDPLGWGDPLFRYRHLDLILCQGIYGALCVHYGVHEQKRLVFVKEITPLPGQFPDID